MMLRVNRRQKIWLSKNSAAVDKNDRVGSPLVRYFWGTLSHILRFPARSLGATSHRCGRRLRRGAAATRGDADVNGCWTSLTYRKRPIMLILVSDSKSRPRRNAKTDHGR